MGYLDVATEGNKETKAPAKEGKVEAAVEPVDGMIPAYIGIDSGASDTVCPKSFSPGHEIKETKASRDGKYYVAANDTKIQIYGQKKIEGVSDDWTEFKLNAVVADVKRPLMSVKNMCEAGHRVIFGPKDSYVENIQSGKRTKIEHTNKGYRMKVWLPHFPRQVKP